MFKTATNYLRNVFQRQLELNPKELPPITKLREELATKIAEREVLYREYNTLKGKTQKVEQIRRSVSEIMRAETRERKPERTQGMEL